MKRSAGLTAFIALFLGVGAYLLLFFLKASDALLYAILVAAVSYMVLSTVARILSGQENKLYTEQEQVLGLDFFYKLSGQWNMDGQEESGRIYFCPDCITLLCLDKSEHFLLQLSKQDIARIDFDDAHIKIQTHDGRRLILTVADTQGIQQLLRERNWI